MLFVKAAAVWLLLLACAVANGAVRELVLVARMPRPAALVTSGIALCAMILIVAFLLVPRLGVRTPTRAALIGLFWVGLTLVFELAYGRFFEQGSWPQLLEAYTFKDGNVWPLVLLVTLLSPVLAARAGERKRH